MPERVPTRVDRELLDPTIKMYGAVFHVLNTEQDSESGEITLRPPLRGWGLDPEIIGRCIGFVLEHDNAPKLDDPSFIRQLEEAVFPNGSTAEERNKLPTHAKIGCFFVEKLGLTLNP